MKKAIIAGASAAVLAAMPVMGVFAEGSVQDTIKVGIDETCQIALAASGAHTNGSGENAGAWGTEATANVLSGTIANGGVANNYGSTTMVITCNHSTGYAVSAAATALTAANAEVSEGVKATIPLNASFSGTSSGWAYKVSAKTDAMTTNASNWTDTASNSGLITGDAPISNANFTVMYGVGLSATQPADNYTGTITYTINAVTPANPGD